MSDHGLFTSSLAFSAERRRQQYWSLVKTLLPPDHDDHSGVHSPSLLEDNAQQLRQIRTDLARTRPDGFEKIFSNKKIEDSLSRILLLYALRSPASGYVQGINDILVIFYLVFFLAEAEVAGSSREEVVNEGIVDSLPQEALDNAEADSHNALVTVLSEVEDNYISTQPGISLQLKQLEALIERIRRKKRLRVC